MTQSSTSHQNMPAEIVTQQEHEHELATQLFYLYKNWWPKYAFAFELTNQLLIGNQRKYENPVEAGHNKWNQW